MDTTLELDQGSGIGGVLGLVAAGFLALVILGGGGLVVILAGDEQNRSTVGTAGGLNLDAVPAQFRQAVLEASKTCPEVAGAILPAQTEAESAWNSNAVSPVGAQGLSQFMPGTWATYGTDGNGDGKADPFNPYDALKSQAVYMCSLVPYVQPIAKATSKPVTDLMLAAYNAGPGAVQRFQGIPPYPETQAYVARIQTLMTKYAAAVNYGTGTGWRDPVSALRGTPFHQYGSAWAWKGWHTGADWPAPTGTPIGASGPGTISKKGWGGAYGNEVEVDHGMIDGHHITTMYAHMSSFANVQVGQKVEAGGLIGYVGDTGNSFGSHVHMEVHRDWTGGSSDAEFLDPFAWIDSHKGTTAP